MNGNSQDCEESISVIIRVKGRTSDNLKEKSSLIRILPNNSISIDSKNKEFFYDYIGDENSTQNDIFEHCGKKICDYSLEGYNGTIFAYGQTGSGKTYTLLGKNITNKVEAKNNNNNGGKSNNYSMLNSSEDVEMVDSTLNSSNEYNYNINDEQIGLLPRILYYLFQNSSKSEKENENKFIFKISYLEIYQETFRDLLYIDNKEKIQLSDINGVLDIKNLRKLIIESPEEAIKYIISGNKFRHTGSTSMNSQSSRSHAIISIYIENNLIKENKIKKSVFHIIDLAGSERQKKTGAQGNRIKEAGSINKSLLNLSIVISKIIKKEKPIPYRDSKLTHILRDSLGGNAKTSIIATISQLDSNIDETINTLNFAQNAKKIKNSAKINEELSVNDAKILKEKFKNLQQNYNSIFKKYSELQKEYQNQRNSISENENISRSLEIQNEDINRMMKDILEKEENLKQLKEENDNLKDKIQKDDIEFKLRSSDLKQMKEKMTKINEENQALIKENKDLKEQISVFEEKVSINETIMKTMEEKYKNEILKHEKNYKILQDEKMTNDNINQVLNDKIKSYEDQIKSIVEELNKSKKLIEEKDKDIDKIKILLTQNENKNKELNNNINNYIAEINTKKNELEEISKNNMEIKSKGKDILKKYNEVIMKNKEEIKSLKETISENNNKMFKIEIVIKEMENEKELIKGALEKSKKDISEYLDTITLLHQQNIYLEKEKKNILREKEQIEKKMMNGFEPFTNRNSVNKNHMVSHMNSNNMSYPNGSKEYIQIKKEYDNLKKNYEELIRNIEPKNDIGLSKVKKIQDFSDRLTLNENEINEYKNIMKNTIKKFGEYVNINSINGKDKNSIKNKFEYAFQLIIDFINSKNVEINQLNEQKEILLMNIKTNNLKKDLFDFLNKNSEENNKKDFTRKMNRAREGYFSKDLKGTNQNNKIILDSSMYINKNNDDDNNNFNLLQDNKENNPNFINSFKNIQ